MAEELNEETQVQDSTTVEEVDVNLDEIFGQPGAESIMLPAEEVEPEPQEKKSNIFSKPEELDTTFIDKTETTTEEVGAETEQPATPEQKKELVDEALAELDDAITEEDVKLIKVV